jgi:WD40 repeat protein
LETAAVIRRFPYPDSAGGGVVTVSPDGQTALTTIWGAAEGVVLWDLNMGTELHRFTTSSDTTLTGAIATLADYSPDGQMILVAKSDGSMLLYDVDTYELIRSFGMDATGHTAPILGIAFHPEGSLALSASADGTLALWDIPSGTMLHRLTGHSGGEVISAAFSPDGQYAVSVSYDTTIVLWDVATGEPIRRINWDASGGVSNVAFDFNGQYVLTSGRSGEVARWSIDATLERLIEWTRGNRYLPEPTCSQRALYRLQPLCAQEVPTSG